MSKLDRRWIWIALGILSILFRIILGNYPEIIEQYYSRTFFVGVRTILDYTIGIFPLPFLYLLLLGVFCFIIYRIFRKKDKSRTIKQKLISFLFSTTALLFGIIFLFLMLWGFNYSRIPVETQMGINPRPLSKEEILQEFLTSTEQLKNSYEKIRNLGDDDFRQYIFENDLETTIRKEVSQVFDDLGYPVSGRLRARYLYPKGSLLRISTAGFYLPLTGECHIDPGLHPLQIPYVMSHELAHGFGIGDEGSCNFIAFLTCEKSTDPIIHYAGLLSYWRSVAGQYRAIAPEHYKEIRATLPETVIDHMRKINIEMDKYPDLFPAVRDATYNAYLKTQGVEEGLKSYSRVVLLVKAYREKKN